jgi:hypothetical protein
LLLPERRMQLRDRISARTLPRRPAVSPSRPLTLLLTPAP